MVYPNDPYLRNAKPRDTSVEETDSPDAIVIKTTSVGSLMIGLKGRDWVVPLEKFHANNPVEVVRQALLDLERARDSEH